jgi:hypothetical protein
LRKVPAGGATWGLGAVYFVFFSLIFIFVRHLSIQEKKIVSLCKTGDGK